MSTIKADGIQASTGTNTDLTLAGKGTGVPDLAAGFKVGGTVEKLTGVAPSTSGNVLTSDGTNWTSAAAAAGGAWNLIGTSVASASASLTITGLDSTYDTYVIALSDIVSANDIVSMKIRVGDSSGIDSGGSDYSYVWIRNSSGSITADGGGSVSTGGILIDIPMGTGTGEGGGAMLYLNRPADGTTYPIITFKAGTYSHAPDNRQINGAGCRLAAIALDRIQMLLDSGNITSGRMTVWGISHA